MFDGLTMQCQQMGEGCSMLGGSAIHPAILIPLVMVSAAGLFFLFNLFFKWIWNITIPDVFGLKLITFWQSFRLLIIASIIFGGSAAMI